MAHLDSLPNHYLAKEEVETFTDVLPDPLGLKCNELVAAFKFLKSQLSISQGGTALFLVTGHIYQITSFFVT